MALCAFIIEFCMWEMTRFIKYEGTGMTQINEQELSTLIEETRAAYNDFAAGVELGGCDGAPRPIRRHCRLAVGALAPARAGAARAGSRPASCAAAGRPPSPRRARRTRGRRLPSTSS